MKNIKLVLMLGLITTLLSFSSKDITVEEYIDTYKHIAISNMERTGIPASITLAQGILESRFGNSRLAVKGNNHFGIKCHTGWTGKRMYHDDDAKGECFRVYKNAAQSYRDHSDFLQTRSRYSFLFNYSSTDYKKWAHGLKKAGYATNPRYAYILIDLIERHQLYVYDSKERKIFADRGHNEKDQSNVKVNTKKDYKPHENKVYSATKLENNNESEIFSFNRIKTIKIGNKDNLESIAARNGITVSRLYKYNDLKSGQTLEKGQFVYLQPKRGKAMHKRHIVQNGETMWDISQKHGVKLSKLYNRNLLYQGEEPAAGQTIYLNKKADAKPLTRNVSQALEKKKKEDETLIKVIDKAEKAMKDAVVEDVADKAKDAMLEAERKLEKEAQIAAQKEQLDELEPVAVPRKSKEEIQKDKELNKRKVLYKVVKGDTLYGLSKKFNVTVAALKKWNNLKSNDLSIGQQLIIYKTVE